MVANRTLLQHREQILELARRRGVRDVQDFGSASRGDVSPQSDFDFLIDLEPQATLIDLGGFLMDVEELLGRNVDVVTPGALHEAIRDQILREAVPL